MNASFVKLVGATLLSIAGQSSAFGQVQVAGTYYETHVTYLCPSAAFCFVRFPRMPLDKLVMFEKVHCSIQKSVVLETVILGITDGPQEQTFKRQIPLEARLQSITNFNHYKIDSDLRFLVGAGKYISVLIETQQGDSGSARCALIGRTMTGVPTD